MNLITPFQLQRHRRIPAWVGPPLAKQGCITLLQSDPGVGKSNLALAICAHSWLGESFLGFPTPARHNVLFVGQDAPSWDYANTFFRILHSMGVDELPSDPPTRIRFLFEPINIMQPEWVQFGTESFVRLLSSGDQVEAGADLVIVDTLSNIHDADENSRHEMRNVMDAMRRLTRVGAAVVLLHHRSINQRDRAAVYGGRGSSVIAGSSDIVINLAGSRIGQTTKACSLSWAKGRAPDLPDALGYFMDWSTTDLSFKPYDFTKENIKANQSARRAWMKAPSERDDVPTGEKALDMLAPGDYPWNSLLTRSRMQAPELVKYLTTHTEWVKTGPGLWTKGQS